MENCGDSTNKRSASIENTKLTNSNMISSVRTGGSQMRQRWSYRSKYTHNRQYISYASSTSTSIRSSKDSEFGEDYASR
jgi:hypothetical protein